MLGRASSSGIGGVVSFNVFPVSVSSMINFISLYIVPLTFHRARYQIFSISSYLSYLRRSIDLRIPVTPFLLVPVYTLAYNAITSFIT